MTVVWSLSLGPCCAGVIVDGIVPSAASARCHPDVTVGCSPLPTMMKMAAVVGSADQRREANRNQ